MTSSQTQGSMQGHEIRDQYFSRLFGFVSIIQSGLLYRTSTLPTSGSNRTLSATLTDFQAVCKGLLALGDKKSWLKESCWWALGLALSGLSLSSPSWKQEASAWLAQTVYAESQLWSSEKVAFTINFQRISPSLGWRDILAPTFKDSDMLSVRNIPTIARILRVRIPLAVIIPTSRYLRCSRRLLLKTSRKRQTRARALGSLNYIMRGLQYFRLISRGAKAYLPLNLIFRSFIELP
jgi:hypothetical protein